MPPSTPTEPGLPNNEVLSEGYQESYHKTEYHVSKIHERAVSTSTLGGLFVRNGGFIKGLLGLLPSKVWVFPDCVVPWVRNVTFAPLVTCST